MFRKLLFVTLLTILAGYKVLFSSAPARFPQFSEKVVSGPGSYEIPQWSPDSRYLAFVDGSQDSTLKVYDTETEHSWNAVNNISSAHFSWKPNGDLTYLRFRPDLSGTPYPIISELHQVNLNGENDRVIASNLSSAGDFAWFADGKRIAILLTEPSSRTYFNDVYVLNTATGATNFLLKAQDIDLQYLTTLALSSDEKTLLVYGIHEENSLSEAQIVIYNLETQATLERIIPSQIIPSGNISYPVPGIGDGTNAGWIGQRWFLASANTPGGNCYNYALFFFDTQEPQNSFCIPTVEGVFDYPASSPDLTRISYVTVVGPGQYYVIIGNVTSDLIDKLQSGGK